MYSVRDVCDLLDIKPHVLRYWERAIPLIAPRKNRYGRRVYSRADVNLLARVKHLVQRKGLTLRGARERLWADMQPQRQNFRSRIAELRDELLGLKTLVRKRREEPRGEDDSGHTRRTGTDSAS